MTDQKAIGQQDFCDLDLRPFFMAKPFLFLMAGGVFSISDCTLLTAEEPDLVNDYDNFYIIVSTFGEGKGPSNGQKFTSSPLPDFSGKGKSYAVLGLGSSAYPNFCAFGIMVDKHFAAAGFTQLMILKKVSLRRGDVRRWAYGPLPLPAGGL